MPAGSLMSLNAIKYFVCRMPTAQHSTTQCLFVNTLRPRKNGRHFPDDTFKWIFLVENVWISINISLKFVPRGPINNIPTLVQVMAWRRPGDKPLSGPMMVRLPTHICVTQPQWVKWDWAGSGTVVDMWCISPNAYICISDISCVMYDCAGERISCIIVD